MIKTFSFVILLTLLAVLFRTPAMWLIHLMLGIYDWVFKMLGLVFTSSSIGQYVQTALALLVVPFGISGVVTIGYRAIKKQWLANFPIWVIVLWVFLIVAWLAQKGTTP